MPCSLQLHVFALLTHAESVGESDHSKTFSWIDRSRPWYSSQAEPLYNAELKCWVFNRLQMSDIHDVTRLLVEWANGNKKALDDLTPLVYKELRLLAASHLRRERKSHTLQPTALVHEAYLRLVDQKNPNWQSRFHFYGVASRLMRQILVDHARTRQAGKRAVRRVSLGEAVSFHQERSRDVLALDSSLAALEKFDPRKCKAVELRYFGGLTMDEIGQALEISAVTVRRDLRMAEAWLNHEMQNR